MSLKSLSAMILLLIMIPPFFSHPARASTYNQMTELTFSGPVEIPGRILAAGTYWFVLQNDDSDRDIVRILNSDRSQLEATLLTEPTDRGRETWRTEVKFVERRDGEPEALLKWFYPGQLTGHEFIYSTRHEKEFARDAKRVELASPITVASSAVAPANAIAR